MQLSTFYRLKEAMKKRFWYGITDVRTATGADI
jgi:hypothetical protein